MTKTIAVQESSTPATENSAIRPFQKVNFPEADLCRRINSTKWPERETVTDATQGVQLATTQALARYWGTEYDLRGWRIHAVLGMYGDEMVNHRVPSDEFVNPGMLACPLHQLNHYPASDHCCCPLEA